MDYSDGTELWKYQWDFIHDPEGGWHIFEDVEEGEFVLEDGVNAISRTIRAIRCAQNLNQPTTTLYFGRYDYDIEVGDLAVELGWVRPDYDDEEIEFLVTADLELFNGDYIATDFDVATINYEDQYRRARVDGEDFSLIIKGLDNSEEYADDVYEFIKDLFSAEVQTTLTETEADALSLDEWRYEPFCAFYGLSLDRRKELLTEISEQTIIQDSYEKTAINLVRAIPDDCADCAAEKDALIQFLNSKVLLDLYDGIDDYRTEFVAAVTTLFVQTNSEELIEAATNWEDYIAAQYDQGKEIYFPWRKNFWNADQLSPTKNIWYDAEQVGGKIEYEQGFGSWFEEMDNPSHTRIPMNPLEIVVGYFETAPDFLDPNMPSDIRIALPSIVFKYICDEYRSSQIENFLNYVDYAVTFASLIKSYSSLDKAAKAIVWLRALVGTVDVTLLVGFEDYLLEQYPADGQDYINAWKVFSLSVTHHEAIDQLYRLKYIEKAPLVFSAWQQYKQTDSYLELSNGNEVELEKIEQTLILLEELYND
jgi:hypothetical protein